MSSHFSASSVWPQLLQEVDPAVRTPVDSSRNGSLHLVNPLLFYVFSLACVFGKVKLLSCRRIWEWAEGTGNSSLGMAPSQVLATGNGKGPSLGPQKFLGLL